MKNTSHHISLAAAALASALIAACTVDSGSRADSARSDSLRADSVPSSTSTTSPAAPSTGVNVDANATPPSTPDSARGGSTNAASFSGIPPLRIGMSEAEARKALGMPTSNASSKDECRYLDTKGRSHAFVMLVRDTVARLDVRDNTVATDAGIRVGDAESRVMDAYRGRVTTEPHKYVQGGHYLTVRSPDDPTRALVFETDGKRVTMWRVGRVPEVRQVEGCS